MEEMKLPMTDERKAAFLKELAEHGVVARAARAASPHSRSGRTNLGFGLATALARRIV